MSLGSGKLGFFKNRQLGVGGGTIPVDSTVTIGIGFSGNTATISDSNTAGLTRDANTVVYSVDSNFASQTIGYQITGNVIAGDFTDATLSGNVTTDANGNVTISKTITNTTGSGHKDFVLKLVRPTDTNVTLATANSVNLYEVLPINASGGDTTTTTNVAQAGNGSFSTSNVLVSSRVHFFTSTGNSNITITDYGNYTGNSNLWIDQYQIGSSSESYWQDGIGIRGLVIGGGATGSGGGAGELGVLRYPIANVATGTYTMNVGTNSANTTAFIGNATLSKRALPGSAPATFRGGCGAGGNAASSGSTIQLDSKETDLAEQTSNVAYPGNMKEFVVFASACKGGNGFSMTRDGGGGAFGVGGANNAPHESPNKYGVTVDQGRGAANGGHGISWPNNKGVAQTGGISDVNFASWYKNPALTGANDVIDVAGGKAGQSPGSDGVGASGHGGAGQSGVVTLSYPYRAAYRFVTTADLS